MKKFLVLALVLGLATMATAGDLAAIADMGYTVIGDTVTITTTGSVANFNLQLSPDAGTLTAGNASTNFGYVSDGVPDLAETGIMGAAGAVTSVPPVYQTGTLYTFTYDGTELVTLGDSILGTSSVQWENDDVISLVGATITIPEPMTIALLGLGGLFLRRKK